LHQRDIRLKATTLSSTMSRILASTTTTYAGTLQSRLTCPTRRIKRTFWRSFENCIPKKKTSVATDHIERNSTQKKSVGINWFHKRRNHSSSSS
jgi:hypothetical protein